jgi:intracellular sulfur oxidation DsrE/DsrF family protein
MAMLLRIILFICLFYLPCQLLADQNQKNYSPSKVVYDLSSSDPAVLQNILDRISMLQNVYNNNPFESSIVVVVHEGAIALFVENNKDAKMIGYEDLMLRAKSLTLGEVIKFKVCEASAKMQSISVSDLPEFVSMVPMADAELVDLQQSGYAYLR